MLYVNPLASALTARTEAALNPAFREETASKELEHFFAYLLLQEMQETIPEDPIFGGGLASDFQRDMLNDALSGEIAESGQLGIAKLVTEQLHQREAGAKTAGGSLTSMLNLSA